MTTPEQPTTLPAFQRGEIEMPAMLCPKCEENNRTRIAKSGSRLEYRDPRIMVACYRGDEASINSMIELEGVVTCLHDNHRRPIKLRNSAIDATAPALPVNESAKLVTAIPPGIRQDIAEAERAHLAQCYRASVVMCRRALQRSLIEKEVADDALGRMLPIAKGKVIKTDRGYALAEGIKSFGDGGAHDSEQFSPDTVAMVITTTVQVANEIFG